MKLWKKTLALLVACVMLFTGLPLLFAAAYNVGDTIEYGSYPQTLITDDIRIGRFEQAAQEAAQANKPWTWKSFGYFEGSGERYDGTMHTGDSMTYSDFTYGSERYRAVKIKSYRPNFVGFASETDKTNATFQDDNGYQLETIYYFHYEPLKWRLLNAQTGLMVCESVIDAQPFQNIVYLDGVDYYASSAKTAFANVYQSSSMQKWLARTFFETAFSKDQQAGINTTEISFPDGSTAKERVFLLSNADVSNADYGFSSNSERRAAGTDYAKCQNLFTSTGSADKGYSSWWLRDAQANDTCKVLCVSSSGSINNESATADVSYIGVRPACMIDNPVSEADVCKLCGKQHGSNLFQRIIAFFHSILYMIRRMDLNM